MKRPYEIKEQSGVIITANKYKEKDCVVTIVGEGKKRVYTANSAYSITSKNHIATLVYSQVKISSSGYEDHPCINGISLLKAHNDIYENLFYCTALSIIQEVVTNLFEENDELDTSYIEELVNLVTPTDETVIFAVLVTLLHLLKDIGILSLDLTCSSCGKKLSRTETYNFDYGGFLCNSCQDEHMISAKDEASLKILLKAYRAKPKDFIQDFKKISVLNVIEDVVDYIKLALGYNVKSLHNFRKWFFNL